MNFSVENLNDACVLVLMECDNIHHKGLMLYPLPFLGENDDDDVVKLVRDNHKPWPNGITPTGYVKYNVIFNMTDYSNAVAKVFMLGSCYSPSDVLALSCNKDHQVYMCNTLPGIDYDFAEATDQIRDVFETIDPLKLAKFADLLRFRG